MVCFYPDVISYLQLSPRTPGTCDVSDSSDDDEVSPVRFMSLTAVDTPSTAPARRAVSAHEAWYDLFNLGMNKFISRVNPTSFGMKSNLFGMKSYSQLSFHTILVCFFLMQAHGPVRRRQLRPCPPACPWHPHHPQRRSQRVPAAARLPRRRLLSLLDPLNSARRAPGAFTAFRLSTIGPNYAALAHGVQRFALVWVFFVFVSVLIQTNLMAFAELQGQQFVILSQAVFQLRERECVVYWYSI
jgi:hypothetical protein